MTRKQYSQEFKLDAISLVLEQGYSRAEASRNLGINPNILGRWVKEHQADEVQAFRGNGKLSAEQEEIRALKKQVKQLEMEKAILKNVWSARFLQGLICDGIRLRQCIRPVNEHCSGLDGIRTNQS